MKTLDLYLNEQLKNEEFRKEWEENQPEMDIIRAMADARISQNLTQKELAERTGINQADISKLENGTRNPSLKLLKRLADGMGMDLKLVFTPKEPQNIFVFVASSTWTSRPMTVSYCLLMAYSSLIRYLCQFRHFVFSGTLKCVTCADYILFLEAVTDTGANGVNYEYAYDGRSE